MHNFCTANDFRRSSSITSCNRCKRRGCLHLLIARVDGIGVVAGDGVGAVVEHAAVVQGVVDGREADAATAAGRPPRDETQRDAPVRARRQHRSELLVVVRYQTQWLCNQDRSIFRLATWQ